MLRSSFWLVFALALAVRAIYILQIDTSPVFAYPVVDGRTYVLHAESLAAGNWLGQGQEPFWQPPLYPYLLGALKSLFPDSFFYSIRWLQALFGALSCGLIYLLGARWFSPPIALIAALAAAFYGTLLFFDGEVLPASLGTLLNLLGLLLLDRAADRRSAPGLLAAGLVFGLSALAVATVLIFIPLAAGWLYWRQGWTLGPAALLLGTALAIAPVTWRNYTVGGDRVLISYNSGVNFYIGNNGDYQNTLKTRPGWEWEDLVGMATDAGIKRPSEKSAYFWAKAWGYISAHPIDYLGLLARKGLQLLNGDETGRNQDIYYWRHHSSLLAVTLWKWGIAFPFGLVAPLALVGLALALRRRGLDLAALFILAYSSGIIAFFPTARYRVPLIPLLLLFAAYAGWWLWERYKNGQRRQLTLALTATTGLAVAANAHSGAMDMAGNAEIHYNLGQAYAKARQGDKARQAFARSVELDPTYWQAWLNLGSIAGLQGDMAAAVDIFRRVAKAHPERPEVWVNLAHGYMGLQNIPAATQAYQQALAVNPKQPRIYLELIQVHFQQGQPRRARQVLEAALGHYPRDRAKLQSLFDNLARRQRGAPP